MKLLDLAKSAFAFIAGRWQAILIGLAALVLSYEVGHWRGYEAGKAVMQQAIDRANTAALQAQHHADELAATQRITDTIAVSHQEEALRNAIASTPDSAPDATRIALGCRRLLAAGTAPASLPAACRSPGRAQAGPAR